MDRIGTAAYACAICNEELATSKEFRQHLRQGCDSSLELIDLGPQSLGPGSGESVKEPRYSTEENNNVVPATCVYTSCFEKQQSYITGGQHFETGYGSFEELTAIDNIQKDKTTPLNVKTLPYAEARDEAPEAKVSAINVESLMGTKAVKIPALSQSSICFAISSETATNSVDIVETARGDVDMKNVGFEQLIKQSEAFRCQICGELFDEFKLLKKHVSIGCSANVRLGSKTRKVNIYSLKKTIDTCTDQRKPNMVFHIMPSTDLETKAHACYKCPVCKINFTEGADLGCHFILSALHDELRLTSESPIQSAEESVYSSNERHREMLISCYSMDVKGKLECNTCFTCCKTPVDFVKHIAAHLPDFKDVIVRQPFFKDYSNEKPAVNCRPLLSQSFRKNRSKEGVKKPNGRTVGDKSTSRKCFTGSQTKLKKKIESIVNFDKAIVIEAKRPSQKHKVNINCHCDKCDSSLERHPLKHEPGEGKAIIQLNHSVTDSPTHSNTGEKEYWCTLCRKSLSSAKKVKHHVYSHLYKKLCENSKLFKHARKKECSQHMSGAPKDLNRQCSASVKDCNRVDNSLTRCPTIVSRNVKCRKNRCLTSGKRCYRCGHCNRLYSSVHSVQLHINSHFSILKNANCRCDHCSHVYLSTNSLEYHVKLHFNLLENAERKFRCDHCNRLFSSARRLKYHIKSHFEKKYCVCIGCTACR